MSDETGDDTLPDLVMTARDLVPILAELGLEVHTEEDCPAREALRLLDDLAEDGPCRFDHNGRCQEHGPVDPPCPHREAHDLLVRLGVRVLPAEGGNP